MNDKTETTGLSSDATEVRAQKLKLLREQIGDVYPAHFHRTMSNAELTAKYESLEPDTETQDVVTVAGRVYSSRNSGMFMDIHDASGKIQIFSHKDYVRELDAFKPRAVGFSLNYLANVPEVVDLAKAIKQRNRDCFVFTGGHSGDRKSVV